MIIWQRWGILAILTVPLALFLGLVLIAPLMFGPNATSAQQSIAMGIAFLLAAAVLWLVVHLTVGKVIDKPVQPMIQQQLQQPIVDAQGREQWFRWVPAHDPRTGQPIYQHPRSTLFFIPMRAWPFIFASIGVLVLILGVVGFVQGG